MKPPLTGRWHHGNGNLVCGTIRIAVEDIDTLPSEQVKTELFDWICHTLNEATKNATRVNPVDEFDEWLKGEK